MSIHAGIVGLPNVGKSTLFNALTETMAAEAANYPFCTIEPNIGRVSVPDSRLMQLSQIYPSEKVIPTQMEFVDIAGLVKGAAKGEGLGNKFLGHIRSVDAILHVVRCFENPDIQHVANRIDPLADIATVNLELILADYQTLEKRQENLGKKLKTNDPVAKAEWALIQKIMPILNDGKRANQILLNDKEKNLLAQLRLLTAKPVLYICNVAESEIATGNGWTKKIAEMAKTEGASVLIISAAIEAELAVLPEIERFEYLKTLGLTNSGLSQVIRASYEYLGLISFFTVGPKEARSWSVKKGSTAQAAAGVIHTDFARGFIAAETIAASELLAIGSEQKAKELGKIRLEGKHYIVMDGDVLHFRFAV